MNCPTLPFSLAESELFGHEKGAFTGASNPRKGAFDLAENGTIFLDEIGDLAIENQTKLLRVLEEREILPLGGTQAHKLDIRVIAATNRDLDALVREGQFREDLLNRVNVLTIEIPPLRDRKEDIPALAQYFVRKFSLDQQKSIEEIQARVYDQLAQHHWPGNVRELRNTMERAVMLCKGGTIEPQHLVLYRPRHVAPPAVEVETLDQAQRRAIERAMEKSQGAMTGAADLLGVPRTTLQSLMKRLGMR